MANVIQGAEVIDETTGYSFQQTPASEGVMLTRTVDVRVPRAFRLQWNQAQPGTVQALAEHFATNTAFTFTPPDGVPLSCVNRSLRVNVTTNRIASATLDIEQAMNPD